MRRLLYVLTLLAACRAGSSTRAPKAPPSRKVVFQRMRPRDPGRPPKKPAAWFAEQIARAEAEENGGRYADAFQRVYKARAQNPDAYTDYRLRELVRRLNERVLEVDTLTAAVIAARDPIVFGEPVRVRVRLANRTPNDILIPAKARGTTGSLFVFDVVRQETDTRAQVVTTRRRVHRTLETDLDIRAGGAVELGIDLGPVGNDRPLAGFRTFTVGGVLRPVVQEVGGVRRWDPVRLAPGTLRSFRPNFEHLAEEPVDRIGEAIGKNAPVHLVTAAALVPPDRRTEAVDRLVDAVRGDRAIDGAIFAALRHLTEIEFGRDAGAWKAWWPRVRETFFQQPAQDSDQPVFSR